MKSEEAEALVQRATTALGEHFDAVQVLVSWNEDAYTKRTYIGNGNWFARVGMAHDFLTDSEQDDLASKLADAISSEGWGEDDDDDKVS